MRRSIELEALEPRLLLAIDATGLVEVPNPLSGDNPVYPLIPAGVPAIGVPYTDSRFGTTLTRVTEPDGANSIHEYSRFDPFNEDQSMILLNGAGGTWQVLRTSATPYNQPANLVYTVNDQAAQEEPRWDPLDREVLWCLSGFQITTVNVTTGLVTGNTILIESGNVGSLAAGAMDHAALLHGCTAVNFGGKTFKVASLQLRRVEGNYFTDSTLACWEIGSLAFAHPGGDATGTTEYHKVTRTVNLPVLVGNHYEV
jgi:hypothetical protein